MSSVECLREFVNERLTAAAEDIFGVFKQTIVQYEEEIDRQRRMLDNFWKPQIKLHRTELPKQHVSTEEEVPADQQLCNQERNSNLDQEDPKPPQIKEEQEELGIGQEGEQLVLKQETDTFMVTPTFEANDHCEDQTLNLSNDKTLSAAEKESVLNISVKSAVASEKNDDHQPFFHNSHVAESLDQEGGGKHGDSGSTRNAEQELKKEHQKSESHCNEVNNPDLLKSHCDAQTGKTLFLCDTCGKVFNCKSKLQRHLNIHTGEKPYPCNICGKRFRWTSVLNAHKRIHTGEKPYSCGVCGKDFRFNNGLLIHTRRAHTGEKPFSCNTCGKRFEETSALKSHTRTHTGERPYSCQACGKDFKFKAGFLIHMRKVHSGK